MVVIQMKIAQLKYNTSTDFESRKRALQRKETTEAYRKSAQYQSTKNPLLEALENLLSGKTEKELHQADAEAREQLNSSSSEPKEEKLELPEVKQEVAELQATEKEVIAHEQAVGGSLTGPVSYTYTEGPDDNLYVNGGEVSIQLKEGSSSKETISILERVHTAALAPLNPSPQDLRVAASAATQMQQIRGEIVTEQLVDDETVEPFAGIDTKVDIPDRFLNDFSSRNAAESTVFGRDIENAIYNRAFNKATSKYEQHIAMVKNGYRSFGEPLFSKTA